MPMWLVGSPERVDRRGQHSAGVIDPLRTKERLTAVTVGLGYNLPCAAKTAARPAGKISVADRAEIDAILARRCGLPVMPGWLEDAG